MIRTFAVAAMVSVLMSLSVAAHAETWKEGVHYRRLDTPVRTENPDRIEVAEVFWYGCPHCYHLKPLAEAWEAQAPDYVDYVRIPAALGRSWEPHARAFYALKAMNALNEKLHSALFDALAGERRPLNDGESLAKFVAGYGVDADKFLDAYNSFGVNTWLQQAQAKIRGARITGTPSMLVNGKYVVTASMAGSAQAMLQVVDYLVEKEHSAAH